MVSDGFILVSTGPAGIYWSLLVSLVSTGLYWYLMVSDGLYWSLLVLLVSTGLYWSLWYLLVSTGLDWCGSVLLHRRFHGLKSGLSPAGVARHRSACWQGDLTIAALPALKGSRGGVPGWGGEGPQSPGAG